MSKNEACFNKLVAQMVNELNTLLDAPVKRTDRAKAVKAYWDLLAQICEAKRLYQADFDFSLS